MLAGSRGPPLTLKIWGVYLEPSMKAWKTLLKNAERTTEWKNRQEPELARPKWPSRFLLKCGNQTVGGCPIWPSSGSKIRRMFGFFIRIKHQVSGGFGFISFHSEKGGWMFSWNPRIYSVTYIHPFLKGLLRVMAVQTSGMSTKSSQIFRLKKHQKPRR